MNKIINTAKEFNISYTENEPMKLHTTFKIGGAAKVAVFPESADEVSRIVRCARENNIRLVTVGNGSDLLVSDNGIDGTALILSNKMSKIELIDDETIFAQAGASLAQLCRFALENSLSGLEFAYGIPGSCGGAAFMNAGAYGGEMKDVLFKCEHIDENGNKGFFENEQLCFSYRKSVYTDNNFVITGIYCKLKKGNYEEIKSKMDDFLQRRKSKQPLEYPSGGSTFKRPEGNYASALIEQCGLKGFSVGDAQVSEKHAGFVINKGDATCEDVLKLCEKVKQVVFEKTGYELEMEVRFVE